MSETPDELEQIAVALDTDPHASDKGRVLGVTLSDRHATLLLELCAALDRGVDEVLQEAAQNGLGMMYQVLVHQALRGDRDA